jgi:hypothetical protein
MRRTIPGHQLAVATKFGTVAPNICGFSVDIQLHVPASLSLQTHKKQANYEFRAASCAFLIYFLKTFIRTSLLCSKIEHPAYRKMCMTIIHRRNPLFMEVQYVFDTKVIYTIYKSVETTAQ